MSRTPDDAMDRLREAGGKIAAIDALPAVLTSDAQGETEDKLLAVQAAVGEELVKHAHSTRTADELAARVRADTATVDKLSALISGVSRDEATSIALRVCAGCIDGAKVPRDEEMTLDADGRPVKRGVTDAERKSDMEGLDRKCDVLKDPVYTAAVGIGPLDKKLRNGQEPTFDGIDSALLDKRYPEYRRRFPPDKTDP
jgi:hypothetical protein